MKPDIDIIVKDILAEDPELGLEVSALRALVSELAEKRPDVTVDATFRNELRTKLLHELYVRKEKRTRLPWWLIYTVPVGVTAMLLIMVRPTATVVPTMPAPTSTESFDAAPAMLEMERGASKRSAEMGDAAASADASMMYEAPAGSADFFTAAFTSDRMAVRLAYVSVSTPAFVVVTDATGVVATSDLLLPGEQTNLELLLAKAATPGATYTATLHYDNGDGVFNTVDDMPALDAAGLTISMTLMQ
jgi:cytoskeletal protein RodZ